MIKFEYAFAEFDTVNLRKHAEFLTEKSSEGWRVISLQTVGRVLGLIPAQDDGGVTILGAPTKQRILPVLIALLERQVQVKSDSDSPGNVTSSGGVKLKIVGDKDK